MAYSGGTAVVDVIPSLRGFVDRVRATVKGIGPFEVKLTPDMKDFAARVQREFRNSFGSITVDVKADTNAFNASLADATRGRSVQVEAELQRASVAAIEATLSRLGGTVELSADASEADRAIAEIRVRLNELRDRVINLKIDGTGARTELATIQRDLSKIDGAAATAHVDADVGAAMAELSAFDHEMSRIDGKTASANLSVDATRAVAAIGGVLALLEAVRNPPPINLGINSAGIGQATAAVAKLLGGLLAFGAVVPVLAGVSAAIAAIGPIAAIAGAGLLSTVLGFSGVTKAVKALGDAQDSSGASAKSNAKAQVAAAEAVTSAQKRVTQSVTNLRNVEANAADAAIRSAQAVKDAQTGAADARSKAAESAQRAQAAIVSAARGVARAEADASTSVRSALASQQNAERTLTGAVRDATRAQLSLTEARESARRALMSLSDQVIENNFAQRRAVLDLAEARKTAATAKGSGSADEAARAQLALEEQTFQVGKLRREGAQLAKDKASADRAGVNGSKQVVAAQDAVRTANERVADAQRGVRESAIAVDKARLDGAERVADAQRALVDAQRNAATQSVESNRSIQQADQRLADARRAQAAEQRQSAYSIAQAQQGVADSQEAVSKALRDQATAGTDAAGGVDKVAQAFKNLSPAAAAFATFLFSLKPKLDELKATAAAGLFPGLTAGIQAQIGIFGVWKNVVGSTAAAMGEFFRIVLTGLASPFWQGFWNTIAAVAMPLMTQLAHWFLGLAQAVGGLILAMLPAQTAFFGLLNAINLVISSGLTPLMGLWGTQLIPVVTQTALLLIPLLNLLGAMTPLFVGLFNAVLPVATVLINALVPVVQALTPFLIYLANAVGQSLVNAIIAVTPFLVGFANWLSRNPAAAIGIGKAILFVVETFKILAAAFGLLHSFVVLYLIRTALGALGVTIGGLLAPLGAAWAKFTAFFARLWAATGWTALLRGGLTQMGSALLWVGRTILGALGPIGWFIIILTTLYTQNQQFRDAINGLLGTLGQLFGVIIQSLMPVFNALSGILTIVGQVFGQLVGTLAAAFVPIINTVAGIISQIALTLAPILTQVFTALAPVIASLGTAFMAIWQAIEPLVGFLLNNLVLYLKFLLMGVQVLVPILGFLATILATVLAWTISNIVMPVINFLIGAIRVVGAIFGWVAGVVGSVWSAIGTALSVVYNNVIKPVFDYFRGVVEKLGFIFQVVWFAFIKPVWDALVAFLTEKYYQYIVPLITGFQIILGALGTFFQFVGGLISVAWQALMLFLEEKYNQYVRPLIEVFKLGLAIVVGAFKYVWAKVQEYWGALMDYIRPAYDKYIAPVVDAIGRGMDAVGGFFQRMWDKVRPIVDAIGGFFEVIGDGIKFIFGGDDAPTDDPKAVADKIKAGMANGGVVQMFASGGVVKWTHLDGGGALPGYSPGRDTVPAILSPGEGVLVPEAVKALGGPAAIAAINAKYSTRVPGRPALETSSGVSGMGLPGFADGGTAAAAPTGGTSAATASTTAGGLPFSTEDATALTTAVQGLTAAVTALQAAVDLLNLSGLALTATISALTLAEQGATLAVTQAAAATLSLAGIDDLASIATTVLTGVVFGETAALFALIPQLALTNSWTLALAGSLNGALTPAVLFLTGAALVPLVGQLIGSTIPTLAVLENHAGVLAVQAILALAAQIPPLMAWFVNLQNTVVSVWATIVNSIRTSNDSIAARSAQLNSEVTASWNGMRDNVNAAMTTMGQGIDGFILAMQRMRDAEMLTAQWTYDRFNEMKGHAGVPVKWILDFPFNQGIIAAWNALDAQFSLGKHVNPVAIPFATGGQIPGNGRPKADDVPIMASSGEFMVRQAIASQHLPFLTALNAGQPEARQAAGGSGNPRGNYTRAQIGRNPSGSGPVKGRGYAEGGLIEAIARGKKFAQEQVGKPYVWAAAGPGGYDCSGFMGAITRVLNNDPNPYRRIGSTGDFPWGGFVPGLTTQFAIGSTRNAGGGVGHMAGTLGGMNVESFGGHGPAVGPAARGADNSLFNMRASLGTTPGGFVSGGPGGGGFDPTPVINEKFAATYRMLADIPKFFGDSMFTQGMGGIARQAADGVKGKATEKLMAMFASSGVMGPLGAGAPFFTKQISDAARLLGLGKDAAIIGVATALVETGGMHMLANPRRPDSLAFPHEGLGQDHDSVGLFQQRANGAWGTTAEQMNPLASAMNFFKAMMRFNWRAMAPGAAAQRVQGSAFPARYATEIARATGLVNQFGAFDDGGVAFGTGFMAKSTIAPERVLSPAQTQSFDTLVSILGRNGVSVDRSAMTPADAFPSEFTISSGKLEVLDDGFVRIVDGRLEAATSALTDGRQ